MTLQLARILNATYCKSYNPTESGDMLNTLYLSANPTRNQPLIVVLEEFDIMMH